MALRTGARRGVSADGATGGSAGALPGPKTSDRAVAAGADGPNALRIAAASSTPGMPADAKPLSCPAEGRGGWSNRTSRSRT
ncbi:hypothetical protein FOHLNKBM_6012 [Methylobacterium longum]|nr:hypothetical protein FOHLNKBM_6012 [Methylobacterium longum]